MECEEEVKREGRRRMEMRRGRRERMEERRWGWEEVRGVRRAKDRGGRRRWRRLEAERGMGGVEEVGGGRVAGLDLHAARFRGEAGGESGSSEVPD